jgi:hypothetical protein
MRIRAAHRRLAVTVAAAIITIPIAGSRPSANQQALSETEKAPAYIRTHCFRHPLQIGMTEEQALHSDWCYPNHIQQSTIAPGIVEYWFYGHDDTRRGAHTGMILMDNGVVTYFSEDGRK